MSKGDSTNSKSSDTAAAWVPMKEDRESHLKHEQQDKNKQVGHQTKKLLHSQKKKNHQQRKMTY